MSGLTDLERDLIEALKTAHAHIANDAMRLNIGNIIARAEAKANAPLCVCTLDPSEDEICDTPDDCDCGHDRACHLGSQG